MILSKVWIRLGMLYLSYRTWCIRIGRRLASFANCRDVMVELAPNWKPAHDPGSATGVVTVEVVAVLTSVVGKLFAG